MSSDDQTFMLTRSATLQRIQEEPKEDLEEFVLARPLGAAAMDVHYRARFYPQAALDKKGKVWRRVSAKPGDTPKRIEAIFNKKLERLNILHFAYNDEIHHRQDTIGLDKIRESMEERQQQRVQRWTELELADIIYAADAPKAAEVVFDINHECRLAIAGIASSSVPAA